MKPRSHPPITTLDGSAVVTVLEHHATPEARIARTLASLPMFAQWTHEPPPTAAEAVLLGLNEQELMTTAAVCLLRLAKMKDAGRDDGTDADAA
ncbi:MAG: hypothetical protein AAF086_02605 [Planctomycetota bacterium]